MSVPTGTRKRMYPRVSTATIAPRATPDSEKASRKKGVAAKTV
jgi:hypothetical protein